MFTQYSDELKKYCVHTDHSSFSWFIPSTVTKSLNPIIHFLTAHLFYAEIETQAFQYILQVLTEKLNWLHSMTLLEQAELHFCGSLILELQQHIYQKNAEKKDEFDLTCKTIALTTDTGKLQKASTSTLLRVFHRAGTLEEVQEASDFGPCDLTPFMLDINTFSRLKVSHSFLLAVAILAQDHEVYLLGLQFYSTLINHASLFPITSVEKVHFEKIQNLMRISRMVAYCACWSNLEKSSVLHASELQVRNLPVNNATDPFLLDLELIPEYLEEEVQNFKEKIVMQGNDPIYPEVFYELVDKNDSSNDFEVQMLAEAMLCMSKRHAIICQMLQERKVIEVSCEAIAVSHPSHHSAKKALLGLFKHGQESPKAFKSSHSAALKHLCCHKSHFTHSWFIPETLDQSWNTVSHYLAAHLICAGMEFHAIEYIVRALMQKVEQNEPLTAMEQADFNFCACLLEVQQYRYKQNETTKKLDSVFQTPTESTMSVLSQSAWASPLIRVLKRANAFRNPSELEQPANKTRIADLSHQVVNINSFSRMKISYSFMLAATAFSPDEDIYLLAVVFYVMLQNHLQLFPVTHLEKAYLNAIEQMLLKCRLVTYSQCWEDEDRGNSLLKREIAICEEYSESEDDALASLRTLPNFSNVQVEEIKKHIAKIGDCSVYPQTFVEACSTDTFFMSQVQMLVEAFLCTDTNYERVYQFLEHRIMPEVESATEPVTEPEEPAAQADASVESKVEVNKPKTSKKDLKSFFKFSKPSKKK